MTRARRNLIDLSATSYYHVIARCVRRGFLCGDDKYSGQNFDHRRAWLKDHITHLSEIFSIKICAYAIMSNHYHLVLKVDKQLADTWSQDEIIKRWYKIYKGNRLVDRYFNGDKLDDAALFFISEITEKWRKRLYEDYKKIKKTPKKIKKTPTLKKLKRHPL